MEIKAAALIGEGRGARAGKELSRYITLEPTYQKTFSIKGLSIDEFEEPILIFSSINQGRLCLEVQGKKEHL